MEMTMLEYQLRRDGYFRKQKEKWYHTRFIAYHSIVATGVAKNLTIEKFLPLDETKRKGIMTDSMKEAMRIAREKANLQLNGSRT